VALQQGSAAAAALGAAQAERRAKKSTFSLTVSVGERLFPRPGECSDARAYCDGGEGWHVAA